MPAKKETVFAALRRVVFAVLEGSSSFVRLSASTSIVRLALAAELEPVLAVEFAMALELRPAWEWELELV